MSKSCKWVVIEESVYTDLLSRLENSRGGQEETAEVEAGEVVEKAQSLKSEAELVEDNVTEAGEEGR